jgi:hypothetical protein
VILCRKVLHPWVSVRRQLTFAAAAADAMHITSKSRFALHADMARLLACASSIGRRRLTALRLEAGDGLSRNGYKASSTR